MKRHSLSNFVKKLFLLLLKRPSVAGLVVPLALKIHNVSYQLAGLLSSQLEADGLHPKHRLMKYHDWFVARLKKDWNVLDIGCGNGALAYGLQSFCKSVFAIDINPSNIKQAKIKFSRQGVNYVCGDAATYEFTGRFDAIVLSNVLEHIEHRVEFLRRIFANQSLENPPVLLLRVPMITRDWISMYKKEMGVEWRLDKTHYVEYTLQQIQDEIKEAGMKITEYEVQFGEFYGVIEVSGKISRKLLFPAKNQL